MLTLPKMCLARRELGQTAMPNVLSKDNFGAHVKDPMLDETMLEQEQHRDFLQELQRLAGIGTLTTGVAHELTNPITVITTTCSNLINQLEENGIDDEEVLNYLKIIDQSAWRCTQLIHTLRDYSYLNGRVYIPCELNQIVKNALALVSYEFERQYHVEIVTDLDPNLGQIFCEKNEITQVVINLLINARDALQPDGGRVLISTWAMPDKNAQGLMVVDTGRGIDTSIFPQIFEPFVTTKPMGEGTGLGLSIAMQIVKNHNGQITARNNPDRGATFTVILPTSQK